MRTFGISAQADDSPCCTQEGSRPVKTKFPEGCLEKSYKKEGPDQQCVSRVEEKSEQRGLVILESRVGCFVCAVCSADSEAIQTMKWTCDA